MNFGRFIQGYIYFILAAIFLAFPPLAERYRGYTGQYLVAHEINPGNYFENSVVYIADHKAMGAIGFTMGKPVDKALLKASSVLPQELLDSEDVPIFEGGPVDFLQSFYVLEHVIAAEDKPSWVMFDFVGMNAEKRKTVIDDIVDSYQNGLPPKYFLFSGHSGWFATQLELEIFNRAWITMDAFDIGLNSMLNMSEDELWHKAFTKATKDKQKKLGKVY